MKQVVSRISWGMIVAILTVLVIVPACNRYKTQPTKAVITVVNSANAIQKYAKVRLYAKPTVTASTKVRIDTCALTGSDGKVEFDLSRFYQAGQSGFAVLDIQACSGSAFFGEGIIKVTEEEVSEASVTVLVGNCTLDSSDDCWD
jgi:hypothetical protein